MQLGKRPKDPRLKEPPTGGRAKPERFSYSNQFYGALEAVFGRIFGAFALKGVPHEQYR